MRSSDDSQVKANSADFLIANNTQIEGVRVQILLFGLTIGDKRIEDDSASEFLKETEE